MPLSVLLSKMSQMCCFILWLKKIWSSLFPRAIP